MVRISWCGLACLAAPVRRCAALALLCCAVPWIAHAQSPPGFTRAQADQGRAVYVQRCARCHGSALDDGEFAPALRGRDFSGRWAGRPLSELYTLMQQQMPPDGPGTLDPAACTALLAYLLAENGARQPQRLAARSGAARERAIPGSSGR